MSYDDMMTRFPLWQQILVALALGIITGVLAGPDAAALKPIGDIFIRLISMIVMPLIMAAIISGLTTMEDPRSMGRMGGRAVSLYLISTTIAVSIGLVAALLVSPGSGAVIPIGSALPASPIPDNQDSLMQLLVSLFPRNPFASMAEGNMLHIILFSILVGIAINLAGDKAAPCKALADSLLDVMIALTGLIMRVAPIGIFALLASITGQQGVEALLPLVTLVATLYGVFLLHILLVYGGLIRMLTQLPLGPFFRKVIDAQLMAFSTSSSAATMPVTLSSVRDRLGVSHTTSGFVVPLGVTVNMDGSAINFVIGSLFVAQAAGIDLSVTQLVIIFFASILSSIGTAGIPGVAGTGFIIILGAAGLPLEGLALLLVVDRISDMMRTSVNVTGDAAVSVIVDSQLNQLDKQRYLA